MTQVLIGMTDHEFKGYALVLKSGADPTTGGIAIAGFTTAGMGDILRKGVPLDLGKSKISERSFLRTRLGEIQINILIKSSNEILVSVLRSHRDYMVDWFEVCTKRGTEINFDL